MHLGLSLRVSQSLEQRLEMELALTESLFIVQSLKLELILYKKREDELTKLYKKALEGGMVKLYDKNGMKFEYALISVKDISEDLKFYGFAFSHCLSNSFDALFLGKKYAMARGSWLLFVVYDMYQNIQNSFIEFAAVHERGEQVTLGDHNLASKLEFAISKKENLLVKYMKWLEEYCPDKFADVFNYQTHLELPSDDKFQEILNSFVSSEEVVKIKEMIEEFEWPHRVIQKLTLYKNNNEKVVEIITRALHIAEVLAGEFLVPLKELVNRIRDEVTKQLRQIIYLDLRRYIGFAKIDSLWRELRIGVDNKFLEMINERQKIDMRKYVKEISDTKFNGELPKDGVLSFSFFKVLQSL